MHFILQCVLMPTDMIGTMQMHGSNRLVCTQSKLQTSKCNMHFILQCVLMPSDMIATMQMFLDKIPLKKAILQKPL
jgi:hypothetical protein